MEETKQNSETKKQEAIRLAWIEEIGLENYEEIKDRIDENGFDSKLIFDEIDYDKFDYEVKGHGIYITRPKKLIGIENNLGWISIESDGNNLPKDDDFCFVVIEGIVYIKQYRLLQYKLWQEHVTHYQPIKKPNPPIF